MNLLLLLMFSNSCLYLAETAVCENEIMRGPSATLGNRTSPGKRRRLPCTLNNQHQSRLPREAPLKPSRREKEASAPARQNALPPPPPLENSTTPCPGASRYTKLNNALRYLFTKTRGGHFHEPTNSTFQLRCRTNNINRRWRR